MTALRAFQALHAIATWHVGDAALLLAEAADAAKPIRQREQKFLRLHDAVLNEYGRATELGKTLQPAELAVLARQAGATNELQQAAAAELQRANAVVEERRHQLQQCQAREESLQKMLARKRSERRAEQLRKEALAIDDLYIAQRLFSEQYL